MSDTNEQTSNARTPADDLTTLLAIALTILLPLFDLLAKPEALLVGFIVA